MTVSVGLCVNGGQMEVLGDSLARLRPDWVDLSVLDGCLNGQSSIGGGEIGIGAYLAIGVPEGLLVVDEEVLKRLAQELMDSVAASTAKTLTFGSGDFRTWLYEVSNHDKRLTRDRLTTFVSHLCRLGTIAQVEILIEPLNSREAPVWNSLEECASDLAGMSAGFVVDRQHTWTEIATCPPAVLAQVRVAHLSGPNRTVPDKAEIPQLVETALSIAQVERILWECRWEEPSQVAGVLDSTRRALSQLGR